MLTIEHVRVPAPMFARRAAYVAQQLWRSLGRSSADVIFTRDLTIAALLSACLPARRRCVRVARLPPAVGESCRDALERRG